jgi:hypothetical protein
LKKSHSAFSADGREYTNDVDAWQPTPQNFLEKIFQIPFSLRSMTSEGYSDLINDLFVTQASENGKKSDAKTANTNVEAGYGTASTNDSTNTSIPTTTNQTLQNQTTGTDSPATTPQEPTTKEESDQFELSEEALTVRSWETEFAERLYGMIPNPRAAKRFSNIYRIIKAQIPQEKLKIFEGTKEMPGNFQVPMLLLAILMYSTQKSAKMFPALLEHLKGGGKVSEALQDVKKMKLYEPEYGELMNWIKPIITHQWFPMREKLFMEWIPKVSRFSFDLGKIVEPENV